MPLRRQALLIFVLLMLGIFLWATVHMTREYQISAFSTSLTGRDRAQLENLQLACSKIDGFVLNPDEVFSFNDLVGERLKRWGYKGAPTIYQGQMVDTPGGGLCQLSSTIYNTALLGGMVIIERSPHLWTVDSVGPGLDAAIFFSNSGSIDLKFKNPYDFPVKIRSELKNSRMIVKMWAPRTLNSNINIDVETLQVYPAPLYPLVPGSDSDPAQAPSKGRNGCKVKVLRIFKSKEGQIIKREVVSIDRYEPVPGSLVR